LSSGSLGKFHTKIQIGGFTVPGAHLRHLTTGISVGCPSDPVVLNQKFEFHSELVTTSVEKSCGTVVIVPVTFTRSYVVIVFVFSGSGPVKVGSPRGIGTSVVFANKLEASDMMVREDGEVDARVRGTVSCGNSKLPFPAVDVCTIEVSEVVESKFIEDIELSWLDKKVLAVRWSEL